MVWLAASGLGFCMDQHDSEKRDLAAQAKLFRELGYDGAGHLAQEFGYAGIGTRNVTVEQRAASLAAEGLRMHHVYARVVLENENPIDLKRVAEVMPTLAAHRSQLVVLLLGNRKADLDERAVTVLAQIADLAKPHGVPVAIYPHHNDYTENLTEALRIVRKLDRPDEVGVMFNLIHWQNCDPNRDLRAVLTEAAPYLKAVSINGTNKDKPAVLPLSQGDFDNAELLAILREIGFQHPVQTTGSPGCAGAVSCSLHHRLRSRTLQTLRKGLASRLRPPHRRGRPDHPASQ